MGGTYGQYSTLMSQHLPKQIPGHPNMIVQSMPGAGGLKATNYAAQVAPKDGSYILMPPDSIVINQLLRPKAARYEADDFTWLGNAAESNSVIVVTKRSGIDSWEDALKKKVAMSSTGKGSQTFIVPQMLNGVFGAKFDPIMGYKGSAGSMHAMELGETEGVSLTWVTLKKNRPRWWDDSDHTTKGIPIIQVGFRKESDLQDVPLARDLAKTKEDRQIVDFVASLGPIGRGLAMVPGAPQELTVALREAFAKMIKDPEFAAEGRKRKLAIQPKTGAEVQAIVEEVLKMKPAVVERAREAILGSSS
jgi:tripartite-type tricarboxylate transporter receptor subunit TctC